MNPEIKAEWLDALRGGEYKQGKYTLRTAGDGEVRYCCLGVLCDILIKKGIGPGGWEESYFGPEIFGVKHDRANDMVLETASLPSWAREASGVLTQLGRFSKDEDLAGMNDQGLTFHEIADVIEEKF